MDNKERFDRWIDEIITTQKLAMELYEKLNDRHIDLGGVKFRAWAGLNEPYIGRVHIQDNIEEFCKLAGTELQQTTRDDDNFPVEMFTMYKGVKFYEVRRK